MNSKDTVVVVSAFSLAAVVIVMMIMFVLAILDPVVDDEKVFVIIGPAFQTIVGGFIGLITGINIGKKDSTNESE